MDDAESNGTRYIIEYVLMGTLDYGELLSLHERTSIPAPDPAPRVDWYEDIAALVENAAITRAGVAPQEFYERLYNVVDLGLLEFGAPLGQEARRIRIFVHNSILPSYQVRAQSIYHDASGTMDTTLRALWLHARQVSEALHEIVASHGLKPVVTTWTLRKDGRQQELGRKPVLDSLAHTMISLLKEEPVALESASIIEDDFAAIKFLDQGREHYLILSEDRPNDFAVSRLYYLTLARARMKHLLDELKNVQVQSTSALEQVVEKYQTVVRISPRELNRILRLRNRVIKDWDAFRAKRSHVELALSFLEFHVGRFFSRVSETPLVRYTPGTVQSERAEADLFYVQPLRDLVSRLDEDLKEALALVGSVLEVFTIDVNLRLQVLNWRLQFISVAIAILSLGIALIAILR